MNTINILLANAAVFSILAVLVYALSKKVNRPHLIHSLWVLIFLKLLLPIGVPFSMTSILEPTRLTQFAASPAALESSGAGASHETNHELFLGSEADDFLLRPNGLLSTDPSLVMGAMDHYSASSDFNLDEWALMPEEANSLASWGWLRISLGAIWILGALAYLFRSVIRMRRFRTLLLQSRLAPEAVQQRASEWGSRLSIQTPIFVHSSSAKLPPLMCSVGYSVRILLPQYLLNSLTPKQLDSLLLHEIIHFKRKDHWVRRLEWICMSLYWWNPVIWWARTCLQETEEECCDLQVMSYLPDGAHAYASTLLAAVDYLSKPKPEQRSPLPQLASGLGGGNSLKRRFKMILNPSRSKGKSWLCRGLVAIACLAILPWVPALSVVSADEAKLIRLVNKDGTVLEYSVSEEVSEEIRKILEERVHIKREIEVEEECEETCDPKACVDASLPTLLGDCEDSDKKPNVIWYVDGEKKESEKGAGRIWYLDRAKKALASPFTKNSQQSTSSESVVIANGKKYKITSSNVNGEHNLILRVDGNELKLPKNCQNIVLSKDGQIESIKAHDKNLSAGIVLDTKVELAEDGRVHLYLVDPSMDSGFPEASIDLLREKIARRHPHKKEAKKTRSVDPNTQAIHERIARLQVEADKMDARRSELMKKLDMLKFKEKKYSQSKDIYRLRQMEADLKAREAMQLDQHRLQLMDLEKALKDREKAYKQIQREYELQLKKGAKGSWYSERRIGPDGKSSSAKGFWAKDPRSKEAKEKSWRLRRLEPGKYPTTREEQGGDKASIRRLEDRVRALEQLLKKLAPGAAAPKDPRSPMAPSLPRRRASAPTLEWKFQLEKEAKQLKEALNSQSALEAKKEALLRAEIEAELADRVAQEAIERKTKIELHRLESLLEEAVQEENKLLPKPKPPVAPKPAKLKTLETGKAV